MGCRVCVCKDGENTPLDDPSKAARLARSRTMLDRFEMEEEFQRKRRHQLIRMKFIGLLLMLRHYKRIGNTLLMASYPEYLSVREGLTGTFKVQMRRDHDRWAKCAELYESALRQLPSSKTWTGLHWVGSTSIRGLVAKPVIDLMITTLESVEWTLTRIALEASNQVWIKNISRGLQFPIGFLHRSNEGNQDADWGFLQMPLYHASEHSLVECNLHIFRDGSKAAFEKLLFRDFLSSDEGADLRARYAARKMEIEASIRRGNVATGDYNKGKNDLIKEILEAAEAWDAKRSG